MNNSLWQSIEGAHGAWVMVGLGQVSELVVWVATGWLVVVAARVSTRWGLLAYFLPVIGPIWFACKNWAVAKRPFILYLVGIAFFVAAVGVFGLRAYVGSLFSTGVEIVGQ